MTGHAIRLPLLIAAGVALVGLGGCPQPPGDDSVLKGTWEVVPDDGFDEPLSDIFVTFDARDQVSQVAYTFTDGVTVTWRHPDGSTTVDAVTIGVTCTVGGNGFTFNGTLNSDTAPTNADGILALNLELGNLSVSMPQGPATLVKH